MKGIWIDSDLLDLGLSPLECLLVGYIRYKNGECEDTNAELAKLFNVSPKTVSRTINKLHCDNTIDVIGDTRKRTLSCNSGQNDSNRLNSGHFDSNNSGQFGSSQFDPRQNDSNEQFDSGHFDPTYIRNKKTYINTSPIDKDAGEGEEEKIIFSEIGDNVISLSDRKKTSPPVAVTPPSFSGNVRMSLDEFLRNFSAVDGATIDLRYYWERVYDWADGKGKTLKAPVVLARKFMASDKARGQLRLVETTDNQFVNQSQNFGYGKAKRRKEADVTAEEALAVAQRIAAKYASRAS